MYIYIHTYTTPRYRVFFKGGSLLVQQTKNSTKGSGSPLIPALAKENQVLALALSGRVSYPVVTWCNEHLFWRFGSSRLKLVVCVGVKDFYSWKEMFTSVFWGQMKKHVNPGWNSQFFFVGVFNSSSESMICSGNLGRIWDRVAIFQHSLEKGSGKYVQKH